jgi:hypothetical protein
LTLLLAFGMDLVFGSYQLLDFVGAG